jgi:phosphate starvation-inducible protein PhoH and related proteins
MQKTITVDDQNLLIQFLGPQDENLRLFQKHLQGRISVRGNEIRVSGDKSGVNKAVKVLESILDILSTGKALSRQDFEYIIEHGSAPAKGASEEMKTIYETRVNISKGLKSISARTSNQADYLKSIRENDLVISVGPAGTGKTYLAMAYGLESLLNGSVKRIIMTRPVVEAGENLGFLPGSLEEKVNPYLRPLYDAIFDMIDYERFEKLVQSGAIEIAPLAYMRGRTLHDAFIILDEAQNTSHKQMQMFLTRLGMRSKIVITGDISQIDLPGRETSGLVEIVTLLKNIEGIRIIRFGKEDVIRHPLVRKIIHAYEQADKGHQ